MKVVVSQNKLNFVGVSQEQEKLLEELPVEYRVKPVVNGYTVTASKEKLFELLYTCTTKYDVELV